MLNGKVLLNFLTIELIKNIYLFKASYSPEPHTNSRNKTKVELDLPNHARKSVLENAAGIDA